MTKVKKSSIKNEFIKKKSIFNTEDIAPIVMDYLCKIEAMIIPLIHFAVVGPMCSIYAFVQTYHLQASHDGLY